MYDRENFWRELTEDSMSLTRWPHDGWDKHWFFIVEMDIFESPLKTKLCISNSWTKWTTLHAARVSRTGTKKGKVIISAKAANTSPWELWTTTPIPATFRSSN